MDKNKLFQKLNKLPLKLLLCVLVQTIIGVAWVIGILSSVPISLKDCNEATIVVEDVDFSDFSTVFRAPGHGSNLRLSIISNEKKYTFPELGASAKYSSTELYNMIQVGDTITIHYAERFNISGYYTMILDARTDSIVYLSGKDLYKEMQGGLIAFNILMIIVELIFCSVVAIPPILRYRRRKKNKRNGEWY